MTNDSQASLATDLLNILSWLGFLGGLIVLVLAFIWLVVWLGWD